MRAPIQHRGEHEPGRDQCCGTDDFHGRSSPGPERLGPPSYIWLCWERPSGPCRHELQGGPARARQPVANRGCTMWLATGLMLARGEAQARCLESKISM